MFDNAPIEIDVDLSIIRKFIDIDTGLHTLYRLEMFEKPDLYREPSS